MEILGPKMPYQCFKNIHTNNSLSILSHTHTNCFPHLYILLKKTIYEAKALLKAQKKRIIHETYLTKYNYKKIEI